MKKISKFKKIVTAPQTREEIMSDVQTEMLKGNLRIATDLAGQFIDKAVYRIICPVVRKRRRTPDLPPTYQPKTYKVETRGSLWQVTFSHGAYSSYKEKVFVFAGNSREEIIYYIKLWWSQGGVKNVNENDWSSDPTIKFGTRKKDLWADRNVWIGFTAHERKVKTLDPNTDYGDTFDCEIKRLDIIFVNPSNNHGKSN